MKTYNVEQVEKNTKIVRAIFSYFQSDKGDYKLHELPYLLRKVELKLIEDANIVNPSYDKYYDFLSFVVFLIIEGIDISFESTPDDEEFYSESILLDSDKTLTVFYNTSNVLYFDKEEFYKEKGWL